MEAGVCANDPELGAAGRCMELSQATSTHHLSYAAAPSGLSTLISSSWDTQ